MTRHPDATVPSPGRQALIATAGSLAAHVAWRVFDTPVQRQLSRRVPPELLEYVELFLTLVVPVALTLPAVILLWRALAVIWRTRSSGTETGSPPRRRAVAAPD